MGKMIVLVGESGSGKTTIQKELGKLGTKKVVTCTTRPMRVGEKDGEDYIFLSDKEFQKMIDDNGFVEHAEYRGWKYGTPRKSCGKEDACRSSRITEKRDRTFIFLHLCRQTDPVDIAPEARR